MKKQLFLSIFLLALCNSYTSNLYAEHTKLTKCLINAINNRDAIEFFDIFIDTDDTQKEIQALLDDGIDLDIVLTGQDEFSGRVLSMRPLDGLLSLMIFEEDLPAIEFLLKKGANPNFVEPTENKSMLKSAQEIGNKKIIKLLQKHGAKK